MPLRIAQKLLLKYMNLKLFLSIILILSFIFSINTLEAKGRKSKRDYNKKPLVITSNNPPQKNDKPKIDTEKEKLVEVDKKNAINLNLNIHLKRKFIQSNSSLGSGAVVMWILVGPVSNNVIKLYAYQENKDLSFSKISDQKMKWGDNQLKFLAPKKGNVKLVLFIGGTRSGRANLGTIYLTEKEHQSFQINLVEQDFKIIGEQRQVMNKKAKPLSASDRLIMLRKKLESGEMTEEEFNIKKSSILNNL